MSEETRDFQHDNQTGTTPMEVILRFVRYVPWIIISVALFLILAFIKLRYSSPIYSVSGKLLVSRNSTRGGGDKFDEILQMQSSSNNLNNEMEIIKSRSMASRVIRSLGIQVSYFNKGKILTTVVHPREMPFEFQLISLKDSTRGIGLEVVLVNNHQFKLNKQPQLYELNQLIHFPQGDFRLVKVIDNIESFANNEILVSWQPIDKVAAGLSASIKVAQVGDFSDVLGLTYETENTNLGLDIVNGFMLEYQKASLEDKRKQAENTLAFILEQMDTIKNELGGVERNLQGFREKNSVFSPEHQSSIVFSELSESNKQLTDEGVKLKNIEYLISYISDKKNPYRKVAATLGIQEPALIQQINDFNRLQLERETALKTTTPSNPFIKNLETAIEKIRGDIYETLRNIRQTYLTAIHDLELKSLQSDFQIRTIPRKEKQLLEVTRQQKILQELYSYLLQKNLETSIATASTISNIKVLEPAMASGTPISPNRRSLYLVAFFVGLGIPVGILLLMEYLNDKVKTKQDIEKLTSAPILGEIGHAEDTGALIVTKNNRHFIAEQFRIVRSNLQYILPKEDKPILMVTSSFSGEGKSFVSTNLGAVLALSGKRTIILEFDIRKPKILEGLGLHERKGITNYIVGNMNINEIIYPVPGTENLYVIPCGPVPPNPSEMLLHEKVAQIFVEVRKQFDTIIVDTAPVGLVSDALSLGQHSNATIFIVRHEYTYKKQIRLIDELYVNKKLPHLSIIINDVNLKGGYGGYYGYGNYGYGYGYGYGSDYYDISTRKRGFFHKLKKFFS